MTAPNGATEKNYIINAYRRGEAEENAFKQEQQNAIEQANEIMEQMDENGNGNTQETGEKSENNGIQDEARNVEDMIFMIAGIVLSIIVLGIVVIRIRSGKIKN